MLKNTAQAGEVVLERFERTGARRGREKGTEEKGQGERKTEGGNASSSPGLNREGTSVALVGIPSAKKWWHPRDQLTERLWTSYRSSDEGSKR